MIEQKLTKKLYGNLLFNLKITNQLDCAFTSLEFKSGSNKFSHPILCSFITWRITKSIYLLTPWSRAPLEKLTGSAAS